MFPQSNFCLRSDETSILLHFSLSVNERMMWVRVSEWVFSFSFPLTSSLPRRRFCKVLQSSVRCPRQRAFFLSWWKRDRELLHSLSSQFRKEWKQTEDTNNTRRDDDEEMLWFLFKKHHLISFLHFLTRSLSLLGSICRFSRVFKMSFYPSL